MNTDIAEGSLLNRIRAIDRQIADMKEARRDLKHQVSALRGQENPFYLDGDADGEGARR